MTDLSRKDVENHLKRENVEQLVHELPDDSNIPVLLVPSLRLDKFAKNVSFVNIKKSLKNLIDAKEDLDSYTWDKIINFEGQTEELISFNLTLDSEESLKFDNRENL